MKLKSVTLAFKRKVGEAGFSELMVHDFRFMGSPSCDLLLKFHFFEMKPKSVTPAFKR
jgi:hypothetical protein